MITLITGAPGAGKTALLVEWLRTLYADRPVYVHGLNGLQLPHQSIDASQWHTELPDGAILVVDEVQQVWRPRGPGHAPSPAVQALETHRHRGVDVFLTTQKPNLVDANVRGLVGRHVHLRDTGWLGRYMYEWPECSENLAWKTCHVKRRYKLPRKAFALYTSASEHTTVQKSRSWMPVITAALVAVALVLVFMVYRVIASKREPQAPASVSAPTSTVAPLVSHGAVARPQSARELRAAFRPRIAAEPNSAPAYDELRKVVAMPRIQGGYCQAGACRCYIQGGLRAPIDDKACYEWLKAPPFDPYYAPPAPERDAAARSAAPSASSALL